MEQPFEIQITGAKLTSYYIQCVSGNVLSTIIDLKRPKNNNYNNGRYNVLFVKLIYYYIQSVLVMFFL